LPVADHGSPGVTVYLPGSWPEEGLVIAPDDLGEETVERLMSA
jgi:hypothetical protein